MKTRFFTYTPQNREANNGFALDSYLKQLAKLKQGMPRAHLKEFLFQFSFHSLFCGVNSSFSEDPTIKDCGNGPALKEYQLGQVQIKVALDPSVQCFDDSGENPGVDLNEEDILPNQLLSVVWDRILPHTLNEDKYPSRTQFLFVEVSARVLEGDEGVFTRTFYPVETLDRDFDLKLLESTGKLEYRK